MNRRKYDMKPYRRGRIIFKFGLLVFMICPPSIFYYKKRQKEIYAHGIVMDMKRMTESGRSFHEIPKYTETDEGNVQARNH